MIVGARVATIGAMLAAALLSAAAKADDFEFGFYYNRGGYYDSGPGYVVYDRVCFERPVVYYPCPPPVVVVRDYCPPPRVVYRTGYYRHGGYYRYGGYYAGRPYYYRGGRSFGAGFYYRD